MSMQHTPFLVAAYGVTLVCLLAMLAVSYRRMRRAERALEEEH